MSITTVSSSEMQPRPAAVRYFEIINLSTLALGVLQVVLGWDEAVQISAQAGHGVAYILSIQGFGFGTALALTLLISRLRSRIALWILLIFFVLGIIPMVGVVMTGRFNGSLMIMAVQTLAQGFGLYLLFTPLAGRWMKREPEIDLGKVFN